MKIYKLGKDVDAYKGCYLVNIDIIESIKGIFTAGKERIDKIEKLEIEYDDSDKPIGDVSECFDFLAYIVNKRCKDILTSSGLSNIQYYYCSDDFYYE